jgi:hypothetical protein
VRRARRPVTLGRSQNLDGRRGPVFCLRMTEEERARLRAVFETDAGPRAFGPWLLWRALGRDRDGSTPRTSRSAGNTARRRGNTPSSGSTAGSAWSGSTALPPPAAAPPTSKRVILDLCAGSGAWSEPYKRAGYKVVRVTLPRYDVRTWAPPKGHVWGVVAAPPCNDFSLARNGSPKARDFVRGMECVNACMRVILQTRPRWWALENPVGRLKAWLGTPRDVWEPCDFGDPWTKRTALWGSFALPERGPYVRPIAGKLSLERSAGERAETPPGFAKAFFRANP